MIEHSALFLGALGFAAYFIESIFGFAGTVIFVGLSGFVFDIKTVIYVSLYASSVASLTILLQAHHHIAWGLLRRIFMLALPGMVLGTLLIDVLSAPVLLKLFAVLLVLYGVQGLLFPSFKAPSLLRQVFVAIGGVMQGLFSTGGPFVLMGHRDNFATKGELRATMAAFFLSTNLWRLAQGAVTGSDMPDVIIDHWWVGVPVVVGVIAGHYVHVRIPDAVFKKSVLVLLLCVGVAYLLR